MFDLARKPIGYTKNGRPIYPIAGGDGTATLESKRKELDEVTAQGDELARQLDGNGNPEQLEKLRSLDERWTSLTKEITEAEKAGDGKDIADRFRSRAEEADKAEKERKEREEAEKLRSHGAGVGIYGDRPGTGADTPITPGEQFVAGDEYAAWMKRFPTGGPSKGQAESDARDVGHYRSWLGMEHATEKMRAQVLTPDKYRALVTSADASAGQLVRPDFRGLLEPGQVRPLTIRSLITTIPVTTDAIEYVREASRISNAATVAEAVALTGGSGIKPEGGLAFELVADTIKAIAEWVPATRRILADAPSLRAYIDAYLTDDIAIELEDQIIAGSGNGEDFTGILNTPGVQAVGPPATGQTMLDPIRSAKRLVLRFARTAATAVLMNPEDSEKADLLKWGPTSGPTGYVGAGAFGAGGGPQRLWGLPVVETEAIPPKIALVGDFRRAILFDRESVNISVGTVNDDFIRNIVRVLAEMRAGFGVIRPAAFAIVELEA